MTKLYKEICPHCHFININPELDIPHISYLNPKIYCGYCNKEFYINREKAAKEKYAKILHIQS